MLLLLGWGQRSGGRLVVVVVVTEYVRDWDGWIGGPVDARELQKSSCYGFRQMVAVLVLAVLA